MRNRSLLAVLGVLAALPLNLAWSQANLPNNPNAATVQGPDPSGMLGYPLATVPATGALPWPCAIQSFAASLCVTQCTSPWIVTGQNTPSDTFANPADALPSQSFGMLWEPSTSQWSRMRQAPPGVRTNTTTGVPGAVMMVQNGPVGADFWNVVSAAAGQTTGGAQIPLVSIALNQGGVYNSLGTPNGDNPFAAYILQNCPQLMTGNGGGAGGGVAFSRQRTPFVFKTVATAAAGNTALWTPAAGRSFRLMRYMVTVTDQATQAGAGTLTFSLLDGAAGVTGQVHDVFVPVLGLVNTGSLYSSGWIDLGNGYLSTAANNALNINLSAALTAGTVRVICCGTEE